MEYLCRVKSRPVRVRVARLRSSSICRQLWGLCTVQLSSFEHGPWWHRFQPVALDSSRFDVSIDCSVWIFFLLSIVLTRISSSLFPVACCFPMSSAQLTFSLSTLCVCTIVLNDLPDHTSDPLYVYNVLITIKHDDMNAISIKSRRVILQSEELSSNCEQESARLGFSHANHAAILRFKRYSTAIVITILFNAWS